MKGIYSALLGVFDENGQPNIDGINAVVNHNIEHCKVDGLYVCGSTGENFLINTQSKKTILKEAAEAAKGRCKLIAHVGSNIIEEVLELSKWAKEFGYHAISAVTPYYYKFTPNEVKDYYRYIADNSRLPLNIYNIPILTGVSLSRYDFLELLSHKNIIGIKYTSNDYYMLERIRVECRDAYLYSGFDEILLSAAVLGIDGAIGSTYNIIGHWAKGIIEAVNNNDLDRARDIQSKMNTVIDKLIAAGLYQTIKEVLELYGVKCSGCRMPMSKTTNQHKEAAKDIYSYIESVDRMC
jgi:N-acetylneuraminate lyase